MSLVRRPETALFVLAFGVYAYFFQAGGWNQNSRFALVRAIVEQHSVVIDDYTAYTRDLAFFHGRIYSEKAPGLSMLAVPVWAALHPLAHGERPRGRLIHLAAYLATVLTVSLPSAVAVVLLFRIAVRLGAPPPASAAVACAYAFATLALPYATLFYAHQTVAALLLGAFALVFESRPDTPTAGRLVVVGVLLGYAIASEYPTALLAAVIGLYAAVVVRPWPRLGWIVLGAAVPLAGLAAYHTIAFGGPFTVPYSVSADPNRQGGLFVGITPPDPRLLSKILFSTERGLLHHTPWLALALPGLVGLWRRRATRVEAWTCLGAIVVGLVFNSALTRTPDDWRGGAGMGTRVLVPWLPFFAIAVAGVALPEWGEWSRARVSRIAAAVVFTVLVVPSAGRMVLATAIRPDVNRVDDPFADYYLPLWRADKVAVNTVPFHSGNNEPKQAWNLGELMGLEGRASLWPLAAFAIAGTAWLAWTVRSRAALSDGRPPAVD